jgi:hypothetical protein
MFDRDCVTSANSGDDVLFFWLSPPLQERNPEGMTNVVSYKINGTLSFLGTFANLLKVTVS